MVLNELRQGVFFFNELQLDSIQVRIRREWRLYIRSDRVSPVTDNAARVGEALWVYREQSPFALGVSAPVKRGLDDDLTVVVNIAGIKYADPGIFVGLPIQPAE